MNNTPAFPTNTRYCIGHDERGVPVFDEDTLHGMALRDYFAAKAMQTFAAEHVHDNSDEIAEMAYRMADAMMAERSK